MFPARSAMGGSTKFEDALAARLSIMSPSRRAVDAFVASHPPQYTPGKQALMYLHGTCPLMPLTRLRTGVPELVKLLQRQGKAVFLVSGGFHAIIDHIAEHLAIPPDHVYANVILFKVRHAQTSSRSCQAGLT